MTLAERLVDLGLAATRAIPPRFAWWAGAGLGAVFGRLPIRDARRCRAHLSRAFPERDAAWVERTARRCFRHFGRMALWSIATLAREPRALCRGVAVEGADNLRELARSCRGGRGTVGFVGHFGNWEMLARLSNLLAPTTMIGRRLRSPLADRVVQRLRASSGGRIVYQDEDVRVPLRELRSGRFVATLVDQDIPRLPGVFVPWFGADAYTPSAPAALALLGGGGAQCAFLYARAGRWVLHVGPRRVFPRTRDREADIRAITAWAIRYEEALVRRNPEQWVWWHLRWRTRPEDVERQRREAAAGRP
jgi:KDO2-lipid IV(A) lauroyltransferase